MFTIVLLSAVMVIHVSGQGQSPMIQTQYGPVQGSISTYGSDIITKFLGIPFAKPPLGALRFKKPQPPDSWSDPLKATAMGPSCHESTLFSITEFQGFQKNYVEDENCLHLNVYVPGEVNPGSQLAVLVFIYGGGLILGTSATYPPDSLVSRQGVIVVTFNYRIGIFGFLGSPDGTFPGNVGLFDQHAAMMWVKINIGAFGGDSERITIFGESAGAESVFNHLVSPLSKNLFDRAIIESAPTMSSYSQPAAQFNTVKEAAKRNCGDNPSASELLTCLQALSVEDIQQINNGVFGLGYVFLSIDGEFLTADPIALLSSGGFDSSKQIIVGFTGDDGDVALKGTVGIEWSRFVREGITLKEARELVSTTTNFFFGTNDFPNVDIVNNIIYQTYLSCVENPLEVARNTLNMLTDSMFMSKAFAIANGATVAGSDVYMYRFDHLLKTKREDARPNMKLYAEHGEELLFLFDFEGIVKDAEEEQLTLSLQKAFAEFAKTGKPTYLTNTNIEVPWTQYSLLNREMIIFNTTMTRASVTSLSDDLLDRLTLWNWMLPGIRKLNPCVSYNPVDSPIRSNHGNYQTPSIMVIALAAVFAVLKFTSYQS